MMFQCFNKFQKSCNMEKFIIYQAKENSCIMFQIKKRLPLKHGQINATIPQVSMFHMFLYIITISLKHTHKLLSSSPRVRAFINIGLPNYTNHKSNVRGAWALLLSLPATLPQRNI